MFANSSARTPISSVILSSNSTRSSRVVCEKVSNAAFAAATAASTSAVPPIAIEAIGCSVAGLITSSVSLVLGSTQAPLM